MYHIRVGVFTQCAARMQIFVDGEPVITLEPGDRGLSSSELSLVSDGVGAGGGGGKNHRNSLGVEHVRRRNRHSAGDITCFGVDEVVALPPNATLGVRFECGTRAQGFFTIRKL